MIYGWFFAFRFRLWCSPSPPQSSSLSRAAAAGLGNPLSLAPHLWTCVVRARRPNSAEQAWRSGETEEEMIAKKLKELQLKAQRRDLNKGDPAWKQKEKERLEMMEKEKHLQGILQHPLAVRVPLSSVVSSVAAKHTRSRWVTLFSLSLSPSLALSLHGVHNITSPQGRAPTRRRRRARRRGRRASLRPLYTHL